MNSQDGFLTIKGLLKQNEISCIEKIVQSANFIDGSSTSTDAARLVKNNLQLPKIANAEKQELDAIILGAISDSPIVQATLMPIKILPTIISKYEPGMHYGAHVDSPIMGDPQIGVLRTDVAMTLFLSDPKSYEGGELVVYTTSGEMKFKLEKGDAIIYPTTYVHEVRPVTSGIRIVAVTWMQCTVRNGDQRNLLLQLKTVQSLIERSNPLSSENLILLQIYSNLLRMWSEI